MAIIRLGKVVATVNGQNTLNIVAGDNININQEDSTLTISSNVDTSATLESAKSYTDEKIAEALNVGTVYVVDATIESTDWVEDANGFYFNIEDENISENMMPVVTLSADSLRTAFLAGMYQTAETFDGYVKITTVERPADTITLTCGLYVQGNVVISGGNTYVLPPATADTLGGVKIGEGVNVTSDGTISINSSEVANEVIVNNSEEIANNIANNYADQIVNAAISSDQETEDMLDDVYGDDD